MRRAWIPWRLSVTSDGSRPRCRREHRAALVAAALFCALGEALSAVPKVVAATPDDRYVLVSNWCTWDLSVISTKKGREVRRIPIGAYPRGVTATMNGRAS